MAKINWIWGTGRRKKSIARVRITPGTGTISVNARKLDDYFRVSKDRAEVMETLAAVDGQGKWDIIATVKGGGISGQAGAIKMGIARALLSVDPDLYRPRLKAGKLLTRDSRMKERKKYGKAAARASFQFSKR